MKTGGGFFVGEYPDKGCFLKNVHGYFGTGGTDEEMAVAELSGIRERIWCDMETEEPTSSKPTESPTDVPAEQPETDEPTSMPSSKPTELPTDVPTEQPETDAPTSMPSSKPTELPTDVLTMKPTTMKPTPQQTLKPTSTKPTTLKPTTMKPTSTKQTTLKPKPTRQPVMTEVPQTSIPTNTYPSRRPTRKQVETEVQETSIPTTSNPTTIPTHVKIPSTRPSAKPVNPTKYPTPKPVSIQPSKAVTESPTKDAVALVENTFTEPLKPLKPSPLPISKSPSNLPTAVPNPTLTPSYTPITIKPASSDTLMPTSNMPSFTPSYLATVEPTPLNTSFEPSLATTSSKSPVFDDFANYTLNLELNASSSPSFKPAHVIESKGNVDRIVDSNSNASSLQDSSLSGVWAAAGALGGLVVMLMAMYAYKTRMASKLKSREGAFPSECIPVPSENIPVWTVEVGNCSNSADAMEYHSSRNPDNVPQSHRGNLTEDIMNDCSDICGNYNDDSSESI
jgi:hypothetical protein